MSTRDQLARDAMREVAHAAPPPPPLEHLELHQPRRHPVPRWATVAAAAVVTAAIAVLVVGVVGRSDGATVTAPSTTPATPTTAGATSTSVTAVVEIDPLIDDWASRIAGRTITYRATYSCFCDAAGTWIITERDGDVLEATYLDDPERADLPTPLTFSDALRFAATANGFARVTASSPTSISMQVDAEKDAIDDEYDYAARDITFVDPAPLEVTDGAFSGLGPSALLSEAALEFGVEPTPGQNTPALPGVAWMPCITTTGPHWTLRSGGLLMVFEGASADDARMTNWAYAGGTAGGHLTMATADGIGVGSTVDELLASDPAAGQFGDVIDSGGVRFGVADGRIAWFGRVDCVAD
jgi:hypothetical protein